ncbi:putative phosphoesterase [Paraburkholderia bryophila]|uniref:Phosphoesterase n=1 Tax=Paraburkholderia bryophila TaxID=420952 RepID=A0A7Z0AY19_9BURK|nr:putative phosphoesterase [Paraburkholderia bryophila]
MISDTHNLVRPEALPYLKGCDAIIHAGDICNQAVLDALTQIAPVTAVRGNNDTGDWAASLPTHAKLTVHQVTILVVHDIADVPADPRSEGIGVVVTGHSHKPSISERDGVLFVNPGSAGPTAFQAADFRRHLAGGRRARQRYLRFAADIKKRADMSVGPLRAIFNQLINQARAVAAAA